MNDLKQTPSEDLTLSNKGYKLIKGIGQGAYAKVYQAEYSANNTSISLACKIVDTGKAPKDFVVKFLPREIDVLVRLNHPHLIHTHSIFQRKLKYFIFMRYSENGDLLSYILKKGCVSENQSRVWVRQIGLGLQYMHELEIAHRDIKCENILLTANFNVKLSDFGFARYTIDSQNEPVLSETYCGSMSYAAPEILRGKPYLPKPTDLWSLGVVLFVMLNKSMPFDDTRMRKLYEQQMSKKYRFRSRIASAISRECKVIVKYLLEPDCGLRYSATQLINSDWIAMDSRLTSLNAVEASALKRARNERKRMVEFQKSAPKKLGEILEGSHNPTLRVYLSDYKNPLKSEKSILACKIIDIKAAPKEFVRKFLPREIDMLIKLNHPHLVHTHSIFQKRNKYFIFMRFMENGDLLDYILNKGPIMEDQARIWIRQLALAVEYMHEMDIAHRDIKCENVLITINQNVKLSDFGFSRYCLDMSGNDILSETFCGSLSYTAPEILKGVPYLPKPTDLWSLGVVLYVMLNRSMPFEDKHIKQLLSNQVARKWRFRSRYADSISENCKFLVKRMLEPEVFIRIKIDDVIASNWIAMDSRLSGKNSQETLAFNKAKAEKHKLQSAIEPTLPTTSNDIKRFTEETKARD